MSASPFSSAIVATCPGDAALDRRLNWARGYMEAGEPAAAAEILADAVATAPAFTAAWFLLGEAREAAGDQDGAVEAFARARELDAADAFGASLRLARLGAGAAEDAMSAAYVRTLFDQYAPRFDKALRDNLAYRGPEVLLAAVSRALAAAGRPLAFARALDLGCGTGLAAEAFGAVTGRMEGVDLSPAMVRQARASGRYAAAEVGDMAAFLGAQAPASADLVLAADALCYVADHAAIFAGAARALAAGGLFAFTVETHDGPGILLRDTLRYAHGRASVEAAAVRAGFAVAVLEAASTRTEKGAPVPGLVAVLARA